MSSKTSHRRAARKSTREALAEVTCRPTPAVEELLALQARMAKAATRRPSFSGSRPPARRWPECS